MFEMIKSSPFFQKDLGNEEYQLTAYEVDRLRKSKKAWEMRFDKNNALICEHKTGLIKQCFEATKIIHHPKIGNKPVSVMDVFNHLLSITPNTMGFSYGDYKIVREKSNKGYTIYYDLLDDGDRYFSENELKHVKIIEFLQHILKTVIVEDKNEGTES